MRQTITINDELYQRLLNYIQRHYGEGRRVLGVVIEKAIREFLDKEGGNR
ncbi:hypothetical protein ES703_04501 [subsurface metagenome]